MNEPDSATDNHETIEVYDTSHFDNPKFGSVTVRLGRARMSQTIRMTLSDAEDLAIKLYEYIDGLHKKGEGQ